MPAALVTAGAHRKWRCHNCSCGKREMDKLMQHHRRSDATPTYGPQIYFLVVITSHRMHKCTQMTDCYTVAPTSMRRPPFGHVILRTIWQWHVLQQSVLDNGFTQPSISTCPCSEALGFYAGNRNTKEPYPENHNTTHSYKHNLFFFTLLH